MLQLHPMIPTDIRIDDKLQRLERSAQEMLDNAA